MPDDVGVLTYLLNIIRGAIILGLDRTDDYALWLLRQFAIIEAILFGILWAFKKSDLAEALFRKLLVFAFILWLISNWTGFLTTLANTMSRWGFQIGSPAFTEELFRNPHKIAGMGLSVTEPLWEYLGSLSWHRLIHGITVGWAGIFIILSYFLMSLQVFLTLVEFWIIAAASLIMLPFGVMNSTSWIAEGVFKALVGICLKILVLAMIISIGYDVISGVVIESPPNFRSTMAALLASLTMAFLVWQAPNLVAGMVMGRPSLRAGSAIAGGIGAAVVAQKGYSAARSSALAGASTGSRALGSAYRAARSSGSAASPLRGSNNRPNSVQASNAPPPGSRERFSRRKYT